jgi:hypothetical protein
VSFANDSCPSNSNCGANGKWGEAIVHFTKQEGDFQLV